MSSGWEFNLPDGWSFMRLTDLVADIVDNRGRSAPTALSGIPLIATNCITHDALYPVFKNVRYVSNETYRTWFRAHPKPGDIIFVNKGTPGLVCQVPDPVNFCFAQDMVALRPNTKVVDAEFLLAALRSDYVAEQVKAFSVGTTIPHLKKSDFPKLLIPVPPRDFQAYIGRLYCNLSRKIEVNRCINRTLEAMAQALYRNWFVNFGPFQDAEFVESEVGLAPKGWKVGVLGDIARNDKNLVDPREIDPRTPYIGLGDMPQGSITLGTWGVAGNSISTKCKMKQGQILFGKLRPYFKKVGIAPVEGVCSTDILVVAPRQDEYHSLVLCQLIQQDFIDYTEAVSDGTRMPRVSWEMMAKYPMLIPDRATVLSFNEIVRPWLEIITHNVIENRSLAATRDYLLPRLLAGEVNPYNYEKNSGV